MSAWIGLADSNPKRLARTQELKLLSAKARFLTNLKSRGKNPYKRYLGSPLRYAGGKSLAVGLIIEHIPEDIKRLVSPFIGGASVEIACAVELGIPVMGFDVFDVLCSYWQMQINAPEELADRLALFEPNRADFSKLKERLRRHWKENESLDPIDLAAHFYFTFNTSYGPGFLSWPSNVYMNVERYQKMLEKVRSFQAPLLEVHCASFENVLPQYRNEFLYCDPPYFLDDGRTFCGMYPQRNFPIHHIGFKHSLLRDILREHRGGFVLSYNDCPTIRKWYGDFNMTAPKWQYTFGQGETRIGENRLRDNNGFHIKESHELLIWREPA